MRADAIVFAERRESHYDLALLDPPYGFDDWRRLVGSLSADVIVIESDRSIDPGGAAEVVRERRYGGTVVTIARCTGRDDLDRDTSEDRT